MRRLVVTEIDAGRSIGFVWWDEALPEEASIVTIAPFLPPDQVRALEGKTVKGVDCDQPRLRSKSVILARLGTQKGRPLAAPRVLPVKKGLLLEPARHAGLLGGLVVAAVAALYLYFW